MGAGPRPPDARPRALHGRGGAGGRRGGAAGVAREVGSRCESGEAVMTGKQGRFEKTLARGAASRAPATILRVSTLLPAQADATGASEGGTFRVRVRVEPADQGAFEASMTMHVTV